MIEDAIKDHRNVELLCGGEESLQRGVPPKSRINLQVVVAVVAMVGVRIKDRVEVDRVHANGDQMRQAQSDAVKVTAVKVLTLWWRCRDRVPRDD